MHAAEICQSDFPTRVGMARLSSSSKRWRFRFPHPRGDGPQIREPALWAMVISPPAWGWPAQSPDIKAALGDFPTRVGMARRAATACSMCHRFPHPRGDGPATIINAARAVAISPPAWGWPVLRKSEEPHSSDFPTRVGMAPDANANQGRSDGFPHPRGDGPLNGVRFYGFALISPPAWGWPGSPIGYICRFDDFPTRVGMARHRSSTWANGSRFPHPRGDGPSESKTASPVSKISPPAWGWPGGSVGREGGVEDFPTRVGMARGFGHWLVWLVGFPHPRGDGPWVWPTGEELLLISPPAWGWPVIHGGDEFRVEDFPTRVGMARSCVGGPPLPRRFPHPRGDGPGLASLIQLPSAISPPAWGWPESWNGNTVYCEDFPTRVGMARKGFPPPLLRERFPHPRGDGPNNISLGGDHTWISPPAWGWPARTQIPSLTHHDFPTRVGMARYSQPS